MTKDEQQYCANFLPSQERERLRASRSRYLFRMHEFGPWIPEKQPSSFVKIDESTISPGRIKAYRKCIHCGHTESF